VLSAVFSTLYCWNIHMNFKQLVAWESNYFTSNIKMYLKSNWLSTSFNPLKSSFIFVRSQIHFILNATFKKYVCTICQEMCESTYTTTK
jgi:hypothetical protein